MKNIFEVLVGALNVRESPGGAILTTLSRASRLEEKDDPYVGSDNVRWLAVTLLPHRSVSGYVCERYVSKLNAVGQAGPDATRELEVTAARLLMLSPTAKLWIVNALSAEFSDVTSRYGILATARRLCHFLAQAAHETAGLRTLEEFGGPSYWNRYEGRADLGNTQPGDGIRYHGRGIFQLTGRSNYRAIGTRIGKQLEDDPDLAGNGDISLLTACEYWKARKIEEAADGNDINEVTRRINGGHNGLAERQMYFRRAWSIWGQDGEPA